jgi:hypothetical protein
MFQMMNEEQRSKLVALVDLDGTLADYDTAITRDLEPLLAPGEENTRASHALPHIRARIKLIRSQPGWWKKLKLLEGGFKMLDLLRSLDFSLNILTKGPSSNINAWTEKVKWCQCHVPDAAITITQDKSLVYGKVLFDDWPPYVTAWLKYRPRGLVIMPAHVWNRDFEHPQVIKYTGDNLDEVEARLVELVQGAIDAK